MDTLGLLFATVTLRPYVFAFLAAFLFCAPRLIGWRRTAWFTGITWLVALACELSSTRTGIPFGWYHYTGATAGRELYILDVPFMDSLSFPFLLYASYCMALAFLLPFRRGDAGGTGAGQGSLRLPATIRTGLPAACLASLFFVYLDIVIDPVALRGDCWFLGRIYYYPDPGTHFGVPLANYLGWATVAILSLGAYFLLDRRVLHDDLSSHRPVTAPVLLGCGLYYGILSFNLAVTFWIGEPLLGMTGVLIHLPPAVLLLLRLLRRPGGAISGDGVDEV